MLSSTADNVNVVIVFNECKFAGFLLFNSPKVLSSAADNINVIIVFSEGKSAVLSLFFNSSELMLT